jgi:gamma-glutamyl-gamma-aminobutyrate hydrolase PuuD
VERPLIAIPMRPVEITGSAEALENDPRITEYQGGTSATIEFVLANGGNPYLIPLGTGEENQFALLDMADGVLLTSGGDIHPSLSGVENSPEDPRAESVMKVRIQRDIDEMRITHESKRRGAPILGICRGAQMLNVSFGDTLKYIDRVNADSDDDTHFDPSDSANNTTKVEVFSGTEMGDTIIRRVGSRIIDMASAHHMAIHRLGNGLIVAGGSLGLEPIIKLITSKDGKYIGTQVHPEWQNNESYSRAIGELFIENASRYRKDKQLLKL